MKTLSLFGLSLWLLGSTCVIAQTPLIVHEWGTFTTLHASNGQRLGGLYLEEERLPDFVYQHALPGSITDRLIANKGILAEPLHVTVKMETPVLYFYAPEPLTVDVRADFPGGTISQWYPQRTAGDTLPPDSAGKIDFARPFGGWISWKGVQVLAPGDAASPTTDPALETQTWTSPRATAANMIRVDGDAEKFLFYRGLGNFPIPLTPQFANNNQLTLANTGAETIAFVWVYEQTSTGKSRVWWSGSLASGAVQLVDKAQAVPASFVPFEQALEKAGLYEAEAKAMLRTWEASYFRQPGFRIFWIVPAATVEAILPLQISPPPTAQNRVFVGRCDMLTPEEERYLLAAYKADGLNSWRKHRHYLGILERMMALSAP